MSDPPEMEVVVRRGGRNLFKFLLSIAGYLAASSILNIQLPGILAGLDPWVADAYSQYLPYINLAAILGFGYLIVTSFSNLIYWNLRIKHPHSTAQSVRNAIKIVGIGALVASAVGGSAGAAAGIAVGGFMGIVAGFATQKVLGQAVAGLFILVLRPFRIGDEVSVFGEEGLVKDITTFFTVIEKRGGGRVFIPNDLVLSRAILVKKPQQG